MAAITLPLFGKLHCNCCHPPILYPIKPFHLNTLRSVSPEHPCLFGLPPACTSWHKRLIQTQFCLPCFQKLFTASPKSYTRAFPFNNDLISELPAALR